jgi:hypothetical protein
LKFEWKQRRYFAATADVIEAMTPEAMSKAAPRSSIRWRRAM